MATNDGTVDSDGVKDNYERFGDVSQGGWTDDEQALMETVGYSYSLRAADFPDPNDSSSGELGRG
ncbi:MAG: hypothetical protein LBS84_11035 [Clostridiales bacterium]|jgi:hypothetical protein|nr:hypothetical protein [Clostridiales bacterium]